MIQKILTCIVLIGIFVYLVFKIRNIGQTRNSPCGGCTASGCEGCPAIDLKAEAERRKAIRKNFTHDYHSEKKNKLILEK